MSEAIVVALISGGLSLLGVILSGLSTARKHENAIRISQAVCVAIDGELCGVFAISYEKTRSATAGLSTLSSYRKLNPMMIAGEFMMSEEFIRKKFSIKSKRLLFPDEQTRRELRMIQPVLHMVGGILGMAVVLVLMLLGAMHLLTPANMFLYQLVWMIPGFLLTEWTRSV